MRVGFISGEDDGTVITDMTVPISQMSGYVDTNATSGSITIQLPPPGRELFYAISELGQQDRSLGKRPGVTMVEGSLSASISWSYSYASGWGFYSMNCRIHYGYF